MSTKLDFIFVISPFLHNKGVSLGTSYDLNYRFTTGINSTNFKYSSINFNLDKNNKITIDNNHLQNTISNNPEAIILIDGNSHPKDFENVYDNKFLKILKSCKNFKVCFMPDNFRLLEWSQDANLIICFSKGAVDWANHVTKSKKFLFYPCQPMIRHTNVDFDNFSNRPYDFGYIVSTKLFRINFISTLLRLGGNRFSSIIISSNRTGPLIKSTQDYLNILTQCKFVFCSRASVFEKHTYQSTENIPSSEKITPGRPSGRISEAIACGCIPIYWQPIFKSDVISKIIYKINHSKFTRFFPFLNLESDPKSMPYDEMDETLLDGIYKVNNAFQAMRIIKKTNKEAIIRKLEKADNFYKKYIEPKRFFNFVKNNCAVIKNS